MALRNISRNLKQTSSRHQTRHSLNNRSSERQRAYHNLSSALAGLLSKMSHTVVSIPTGYLIG